MTIGIRHLLLSSGLFALAACGGGGAATQVSFIPPAPTPAPVAPPPPPPTTAANYIVAANTGTSDFETRGAFVSYDPRSGSSSGVSIAEGELSMGIRYDWSTNQYLLRLPYSSFWEGLFLNPNQVPNTRDFRTAGTPVTYLQLQEFAGTGYNHSALALWSIPGSEAGISGGVAFGIPTLAGGVPSSGSATYNGSISGRSTQTSFDGLAVNYWPAIVEGGINLTFDFGAATLSGRINPIIYDVDRRAIAPLSFTDTLFTRGATSFSGRFDTGLAGANGFSGRFTGPQAQELVGSFAFPYSADGKTFQAVGAFVGKQ